MFQRDVSLKETGQDIEWQPKYIKVIACLFVCVLMLTSIVAQKIVQFGPLQFSASTFVFPLTCIFGDILTEIYGFNRTRRIIWTGFICNLIFVVFTMIAIALPASKAYLYQSAFAQVLGSLPRMTLATFVAYLVSEIINSKIMSTMKIWYNANNFPLRAIASTIVAQLVDSLIFFTLAFYGTVLPAVIFNLIFCGWAVKVIYEIALLPVTTWIANRVKKLEGIEHFDHQPTPILKF